MNYKIEYKGYDVEIVDSQGIGSWSNPLTNTPYGVRIWHENKVVYEHLKMTSSESYAIDDAIQHIDRLLIKGRREHIR